MELHFTSDWFSHNIAQWQHYLAEYKGKPGVRFLEIGSYEGRSACWLLQNILTHDSARLTCVDLFERSKICDDILAEEGILNHADPESNFDWNIRAIHSLHKVRKYKGVSQHILRTLPMDHFDCIYIDGSHIGKDVLEDAVLSWPLLREGGILIFDDYALHMYDDDTHNPQKAIDAFLSVYAHEHVVLHTKWQMIVRKVPQHAAYTLSPEFLRTLQQGMLNDNTNPEDAEGRPLTPLSSAQ